jgi:hypothetical protein
LWRCCGTCSQAVCVLLTTTAAAVAAAAAAAGTTTLLRWRQALRCRRWRG